MGNNANSGTSGVVNQRQRYEALIEETDWDLQCWKAVKAANPGMAHSALITAVGSIVKQTAGVAILADMLYGLAYHAPEATAGESAT